MDRGLRARIRARRRAARASGVSMPLMPMVTIDAIPGARIDACLGSVVATVAKANSAAKDIKTSWGDALGGRLAEVEDLANDVKAAALRKLSQETRALGGNAVVGLRVTLSAPTTSVLLATAVGTAVHIHDEAGSAPWAEGSDEQGAESDEESDPAPPA